MSYELVYTKRAVKELAKLDRYTKSIIKAWIDKNLIGCSDPRAHGKALSAELSGLWRYRIGDYRLICELLDDRLVILAVHIGHRRDVYDK